MKTTPAQARTTMRNNINSLKVSRRRLEQVIENLKQNHKTQLMEHKALIKELDERVRILEKKSWGFGKK